MARTSKEYKEGYDAAIEAIKNALNGDGGGQNGQGGGSPQSPDGRDMDLGGTPAGQALADAQNSQNISDGSQSGSSGGQGDQSGNQQGSSGRGSGSQGVVTPQDCAGQFGNSVPSTPGGFMDPDEGNKLAKQEGYGPGPTADAAAAGWKEAAIQAASKSQGKGAGTLMSKILDIWKTSTDWKKAFKKIIGHSLNTQDKRSAYANKNVLATRNMVARTEKDKYDCVDYMCIFTDSSGSVSDSDLQYMLSEIYAIAYAMKPETLVVGQFDTKIQDIQIFHDPKEFKKYTKNAKVKGRGGTDCQCIWELLRNDKRFKKNPAELVIIMTDGYLTQHRRDPKKMNNLCWAILDNAGWDVESKEPRTSCIHLKSKDIKK